MPAVPSGSTVLITGASGFIAVWVVKELVDRGYKVRGTVRSSEKGDYIKAKFPEFEYVIVEDLEQENAFDDAVKGVDAVLHTASPFHFNVTDPYKDLVNPAVNGTVSVLKSAKDSKSIKRIVITSSFAAVLDTSKPVPTKFTEDDWNEFSPKSLEEKGKDVSPADAYRASKTLAERAAWEFVEKNKPGWDIATMNPPFVIGPIIHQVNKPESLNTSIAAFYGFLSGKKSGDDAKGPAGSQIDVRDLAHAHVQALALEEAGGQRFAITNQAYAWQDCLDIVADDAELKKTFPNIPTGTKGIGAKVVQNTYDNAKSKKVLQMKYRSLEETTKDMAHSLAEREKAGWKN